MAEVAARLKLKHVVVTSVTRDDLPDGGAGVFAAVIRAVRQAVPGVTIEVLTPDFQGREGDVRAVLAALPDVFNHNLETVRRLQKTIRPAADYERSLRVLRWAAAAVPAVRVKSGLMVGLGETEAELDEALQDLRTAGCQTLTIGQYLAPSPASAPVARYPTPAEFERYGAKALALGFEAVASGPLVRSSYHAEEMLPTKGLA